MKVGKRARKKAEKAMAEASMYSKYDEGSNLLEQLSRRDNRHTPDFHILKQQDFHPVFVYGTLKAGNRLHDAIKHCQYLGRAQTATPLYDLKNAPNGGFPVAFKVPSKPSQASWKIRGELYAVDPMTMLVLDEIESNGHMYQRHELMMKCLDQSYTTQQGNKLPYLKSWIYIGRDEYWENYALTRPGYSREMNEKGGWDMIFDWSQKGAFNHVH